MKIFVEFKDFETRDKYIVYLSKRGFETLINSFGTLLIKIDLFRISIDKSIIIEYKFNCYKLENEDINYIEIQRGE